jgi:UDP-N-acetylglucosamine acyltransferase
VSKIHPTAILSGTIDLADDVEIGPYCVLSGEIRIGAGSVLIANVHVHGPMIMGSANVCYPGVTLGFAPQDRSFAPTKLGSGVVIGDHNTLREHVTIHRATRDDRPTRVGNRNYLMACSHLAHDVQVGDDCTLANTTNVAGHAEIGDRVITGGGAGIHQFSRIGRGAMIGGLTGAGRDVCPFFTLTATNYVGGYNRIGLKRGGASSDDIDMVRTIYGILIRAKEPFSQRRAQLETLAGHPVADEYIAFVRASKRGITTRHGRVASARSFGATMAEAE